MSGDVWASWRASIPEGARFLTEAEVEFMRELSARGLLTEKCAASLAKLHTEPKRDPVTWYKDSE